MRMFKLPSDARVLFFSGKNEVAKRVLDFLKESEANIVHIFYEDSSIDAERVRWFNPDVIIACYWPFILKEEVFEIPTYGCINFHPALLPRNRGWYPAVWSVLEGGVTGVTLHLIDQGADTGDILGQKEWTISETDTGGDVYRRAQNEMVELFKEVWVCAIEEGIIPVKQDHSKATYHTKKETNEKDFIDINRMYVADDLLTLIKAKTFGDRGFARYEKNGKRYSVAIKITEVL
jgi:methionyl-tRNA formyltransferase